MKSVVLISLLNIEPTHSELRTKNSVSFYHFICQGYLFQIKWMKIEVNPSLSGNDLYKHGTSTTFH